MILGEEVAASKLTLFDITKQICDAVQARAEQGLESWFAIIGITADVLTLSNNVFLFQINIMVSFCCQRGL